MPLLRGSRQYRVVPWFLWHFQVSQSHHIEWLPVDVHGSYNSCKEGCVCIWYDVICHNSFTLSAIAWPYFLAITLLQNWCTSCATSGGQTRPVPIAHTGSYASTTWFISSGVTIERSFKSWIAHTSWFNPACRNKPNKIIFNHNTEREVLASSCLPRTPLVSHRSTKLHSCPV